MTANRLSQQTSPYLLQHAKNPVHWQPWDAESLQLALDLEKPILLSIGYSACHWCHVMAHESFEDEHTASVMNKHFVNIKIDREERPDLDQIYQLAHQMLTQQRGGWPLTMFLTPDQHIPFFGGTYFPPKAAHGLPAFTDMLDKVAEFYALHQDQISEQSDSILQVFRDSSPQAGTGIELTDLPLYACVKALTSEFDAQSGGFGGAPKFPQVQSLERLMRDWRASAFDAKPNLQSLFMATHSLTQMARGGLYDQLGGGFFRYSVDAQWRIPHFEKMTNDNAQLLCIYSDAWRATGDGLFGRVAHQTADWLWREMQAPDGGFYAALDADSEGHEGQFYVWDKAEVDSLLSTEQQLIFNHRYGLNEAANFEGAWHLYLAQTKNQLAGMASIDNATLEDQLSVSQAKLFAARERRQRPLCDTKRLCSSNALLIRALAIAGRQLERPELLDAAEQTLAFIQQHLWRDGRLFTSFHDQPAHLNAYLDDYAFLLDGVIEVLQSRWNSQHMKFCQSLAETLLEQFFDRHEGGFFFTSDDHETLLHRMKPLADEATPSGNGVAARALIRLGHLLGENRYIEAGERTIKLAWPAIERVPHAHCSLLDALEYCIKPFHCIIIRAADEHLQQWHAIATTTYAPNRMVFSIPNDATELPEALAVREPRESAVAYICQGHLCSAPITNISEFSTAVKRLH